ncbi:MAG: iron uptake porin [Cyanobacteriota bacterium]|nr:iron uptake porin [Cyanobacteriota bacterium]
MTRKGPFLRRKVTAAAIATTTLAILAASSPSNAAPGESNLSPAPVIPVDKLERPDIPNSNLPQPAPNNNGPTEELSCEEIICEPSAIELPYSDRLEQVTSVSQLSDVNPTDWAFQALQSLVERYGCIAGYPDGSFRGDRPITRYEFAAALNACLERITEVFVGLDTIRRDDLEAILRMQEDFAAELASLENRIDVLEFRTAKLEVSQFSPTSKLLGEVIFGLNGVFSGEGQDNVVFQYRTRLVALASFTGKDQLWMRFVYASNADPPVLAGGTREILQTYQFFGEIPDDVAFFSYLEYVFPVGDKMRVHVSALNGSQWFGLNFLNPNFENFEGGTGALSLFGTKNPVYRLGGGSGIGFTYQFNPALAFTAGYLAGEPSNPSVGAGLFDGNTTTLVQLTWTPSPSFGMSVLYNRAHFEAGSFTFGDNSGVIRIRGAVGSGVLEDVLAPFAVNSNSYAGQFSWRVSPKFILSGWVGLTEVEAIEQGDGEIWNYALTFGLPDLGGEGHFGGIVLGVQPYLASLEGVEIPSNDTSVHVEAFYRYQIRQGIWLTPGFIWLTAPNQNRDNEDIFLWTLRTTFLF